jgi:hypothetical protein
MKSLLLPACLSLVLIASCLRTEGVLSIRGKVTDRQTGELLPGRGIVINGQLARDSDFARVFAGQTSTGSTGMFASTINLIRDVHYYDFSLVGDSDYYYDVRTLGLGEMKQNAGFLSFTVSRLVPLTIRIARLTSNPTSDTLTVSWKSGSVEEINLSPFKIINSGIKPALKLCWIGRNVSSSIETRVFAGLLTTISYDLIQKGRRTEVTDTITCGRHSGNIVYFRY